MTEQRLTLLEWAQERLANTQRIAATKHGDERSGWFEDAIYWADIVAAIRNSSSWRCFQCGMVLTTEHEARNHFGDTACVSLQHERERQALKVENATLRAEIQFMRASIAEIAQEGR